MIDHLTGFLGLAALAVGLFAWLRADIKRLGERVDRLVNGQADLRERMAKLEALLEGLREAIAGRRPAA